MKVSLSQPIGAVLGLSISCIIMSFLNLNLNSNIKKNLPWEGYGYFLEQHNLPSNGDLMVGKLTFAGLKITAGQRTMSGLIEALTGQTFELPVILTGQN